MDNKCQNLEHMAPVTVPEDEPVVPPSEDPQFSPETTNISAEQPLESEFDSLSEENTFSEETQNSAETPKIDEISVEELETPSETIKIPPNPVGTPAESPETPSGGPNRDDYCLEEPPKLKYYDEAERQEEINKYKKFKKVDGETYRKVNVFLRKRTYITAREWALARLCSDFKTPYGSEMTFIGEHLPELCPFMQEPYSPQAVNQARTSFKSKVRKSAATFLYGAMCGFFTPEELDDILFEANEVSKFFLEIEGTTLKLDDEIDIEDKISNIMKSLNSSARSMLATRMGGEEEDDEVEVVPVEDSVSSPVPEEMPGEDILKIQNEDKPYL